MNLRNRPGHSAQSGATENEQIVNMTLSTESNTNEGHQRALAATRK